MGGIYSWLRGIVGFLILSAFLLELLPSRRYETFLRTILGILLILVVVRPLLAAGGLSEWLPELITRWEGQITAGNLAAASEEEWESLQMDFWEVEAISQTKQEIQGIVEGYDMKMTDCDIKVEDDASTAKVRARDLLGRDEEEREEAACGVRKEILNTFDLDEVTVEVTG